jgi:hypothetical protein
MSVTGADHPSEPARLLTERRTQSITRKLPVPGKSLSPLSYLISLGLIATWITGVFFGVGFSFLMTRSEKPVSGLRAGSADFSKSLAESPWLLHAMSRLDQLFPEPSQLVGNGAAATPDDRHQFVSAPSKQVVVELDPQAAALAEPRIDRTAHEPEGQALSVDLGTAPQALSEAMPAAPLQSPSSGAAGQQGVEQSARSASSRKEHQRPTERRTPQSHAPVQAIQDVLQKHSRLLK